MPLPVLESHVRPHYVTFCHLREGSKFQRSVDGTSQHSPLVTETWHASPSAAGWVHVDVGTSHGEIKIILSLGP